MIFVLVLAFSGCGRAGSENNNPIDIFEHKSEEKIYDRDAREHWVLGENGEKLEIAAHELDTNDICTICKCQVEKYADGHSYVYNYDEHGNILRGTAYDINGTVKEESFYEYGYDEHGNIIFENYSLDSVLTPSASLSWSTEFDYAPDSDGNFYVVRETKTYNSGQSAGKSVYTEYIEGGRVSAVFYYDGDGTLYYETHNEYLPDENGELYVCKSSAYDFENGHKHFYEYRPDGQLFSMEYYNDSGDCVRKEVYEYDQNGRIAGYAVFICGELTGEYYYKTTVNTNGDEYSYIAEEYAFNEDGTGTHYEYNETGEILSEENFG